MATKARGHQGGRAKGIGTAKTAAVPARRPKRARKVAAGPAAAVPIELADLRRRQILDAAEACFRKHGFHGTSMAEIAMSFGMSAGHIYNYFESKEAIIAGIVERDLEEALRLAAELQGAFDMTAALLERVDEGVTAKLDASTAQRQIEVLAEAGRNPKVQAMVQAADARIRAVLRDLVRRTRADGHAGRNLDGKVAVLLALFDGLMVRGLRQDEVNRRQVTRVLSSLVARLIA